MPKLAQVIAVERNIKQTVQKEIDQIDKAVQKPGLFDGQSKVYKKRNEGDEDVPSTRQVVQAKTKDVLEAIKSRLATLLDTVATKDKANLGAVADVEVEGEVILTAVPSTYLLYLEKQLTDLGTLIGRMPTLDPAEVWIWDSHAGVYKSEPILTSRTKKVQKPIVLYQATDKHPAQTQLITEDENVGTWELTKFSGAMLDGDKKALLRRVEKLFHAVKYAREKANTVDAPLETAGTKIMGWLFKA